MAVAAARTAVVKRTIKPHVPLIKFPPRDSAPITKDNAGKQDAVDKFLNSVITDVNPAPKGTTGPSIDASQIPQKYRRKILTKEEMEFIEKGGPV